MDVIFHFLCNLECLEDDFFQNVKKTDQIHQRFFLQKFRAAKYFGPTLDRLSDQLAVQSGRQNCKQIDFKMKYRFTRSAKPDAVLERLDKLVNPSLRSWSELHKSLDLTTNKVCYIQHCQEQKNLPGCKRLRDTARFSPLH